MSEKALDATDFPAIDIDSPSLKEILWHKMREDLSRYIPRILDTEKLMCPACCRFLPFADFDIEHIIPEQSLADDPPEVRAAIPKIERGGVTLLCKKQLLINGKKIYANGSSYELFYHDDGAVEKVMLSKTGVKTTQYTQNGLIVKTLLANGAVKGNSTDAIKNSNNEKSVGASGSNNGNN